MNNIWKKFKKWTTARIGLGRTGYSLKTKEWLTFLRSHAEARYAVHTEMDWNLLNQSLSNFQISKIKSSANKSTDLQDSSLKLISLESSVQNRQQYLLRPDLGRILSESSRQFLKKYHTQKNDICFVVTEGLSALAVQSYSASLIQHFIEIENQDPFFRMGPICVVKNGRVAIGDEIGNLLKSQIVVVLIGERPGLSAADSLGIYFTYDPKTEKTDADRNCISNIRNQGFPPEHAALKLNYLLRQSMKRQLSGVDLKDDVVLNYDSANLSLSIKK